MARPDDSQVGQKSQNVQAARWVQALLGLAVIGVAIAIAWGLVQSKPSSRRKPKPREAAIVEVVVVRSAKRNVTVEGSGKIVPAHALELRPQLSGRVRSIGKGLVPGSIVAKGAMVAQIDARDHQIAVIRAKSSLKRARAALAIEHGSQSIARAELDRYNKEFTDRPQPRSDKDVQRDQALVLRKPQLSSALADVTEAKALLAQTRLDASRTRITAPFDALLRARTVTRGMYVSPTTTLASLVGTEQWWVEVTIPKNRLRWLPDAGGIARVYDSAAWGPERFREARVLRVAPEVVNGGRMVRVVVAIDDPLGLKNKALVKVLLGSWAQVQIEGGQVQAVDLDRQLLRDGDAVWVMNKQDKLEVRKVVIGARSRGAVMVTGGLFDGDRVISSGLRPVEGMSLRIRSSDQAEVRQQ